MFGYVKPRACELLVKEYELYKSAYCGLCIEGGREVSRLTRFLLNDDFVFLCLLRMAVTGVKPETAKKTLPLSCRKAECACEERMCDVFLRCVCHTDI